MNNLPSEQTIVRSIEVIVGIEPEFDKFLGHATVPFLNDLITSRQLDRSAGCAVEPFENAILRRYEDKEISEISLWERFEAAAQALRA